MIDQRSRNELQIQNQQICTPSKLAQLSIDTNSACWITHHSNPAGENDRFMRLMMLFCSSDNVMRMQENNVPLPMLLDFHGWTENSMGHENDGHNFFQVYCQGDFYKIVKTETKQPPENYASHLRCLKV